MIKLSLQNTWAHKRRLVGTFLAVLIGVGFLSGTLILGDTLRDNFDRLFRSAYAGIDVLVRPVPEPDGAGDDAGFSAKTLPASLAAELASVPGVRVADAEVSAFGQVLDRDGEPLGGNGPPTLAGNWVDDDGLNPYRLVDGRAPEGPEEVVLDDETAASGDLRVGDTTTILLPEPLGIEIVGIAEFGDGDSAAGATFAFFSESGTETHLVRTPGTATQISVAAEDGVGQEELRDRIAPLVGDGNEALTGEAAADDAVEGINEDFLGFLTTFLVVFAGIAVFVASFSIYNTFSIIVAQRSRESALMRAIGATRGQVMSATMVEALLIGVVASVVGLFAGLGVAAGLKSTFAAFDLDLPVGGLTIKTSGIVISLIVGILVTVASAVVPARRGGRVRPIEALRASAVEVEVPRARRAVVGAVLAVVSVGALVWSVLGLEEDQINVAGPAALGTLVAMLVLGPVVARPVARLIGAIPARLGGVTGELARENAVRNPRRTASTSAALLVGVAIVVLFSVFIASLKALVSDSVDRTFGGDLVIATGGFGLPSLPPELADQVGELDGVASSVGYGVANVKVGDTDADWYGAADVAAVGRILDLNVIAGSTEDVSGDGVAVSEDAADELGVALGDRVPVRFEDGVEGEAVVRAVYGNADIVGSYLFPRTTTQPHSTLSADAVVFVDVVDGVSLDSVRREIEPLTDAIGKPSIQDRDEYTEMVAGQLDQLLGLIVVMLGLAIIIAAMGIANTIALSVHERTRELGLLRAVGTTRPQVRRLVRSEAVIVSTFGTIGGVGLGVGLGWALTGAVLTDATSRPFAVPVGILATVFVVGVVIGVLAAVRPAYRAARMPVLEAVGA